MVKFLDSLSSTGQIRSSNPLLVFYPVKPDKEPCEFDLEQEGLCLTPASAPPEWRAHV